MSRIWRAYLSTAVGIAQLALGRAEGTVIRAVTANKASVLGSAFDQRAELFLGQACVEGSMRSTGPRWAEFHLETSLSKKDLSSMLGLDVDSRARFSAGEANASAHFQRDAASSAFTVSAVWSSADGMPAEILTSPKSSQTGDLSATDSVNCFVTCGAEFGDKVIEGARLMVSDRFDLASKAQKEEFRSRFSPYDTLASINALLKQASTEFLRAAKVTDAGALFGSDVSGNELPLPPIS